MSECHRRETGLNIQPIHDDDDDDDGAPLLPSHCTWSTRVVTYLHDIKIRKNIHATISNVRQRRKVICDSITGVRRQLIKLTNRRHSFPPEFRRIFLYYFRFSWWWYCSLSFCVIFYKNARTGASGNDDFYKDSDRHGRFRVVGEDNEEPTRK